MDGWMNGWMNGGGGGGGSSGQTFGTPPVSVAQGIVMNGGELGNVPLYPMIRYAE